MKAIASTCATLLVLLNIAVALAAGKENSTADQQTDGAQVTLYNSSRITLDLYVDGAYAGRALAGGVFTAQVTAGRRTLEARDSNGNSVASRGITVAAGGTFNWTLVEK